MKTLEALKAKKREMVSKARALLDDAGSDQDLTDDAKAEYKNILAEIDRIQQAIDRELELADLESNMEPEPGPSTTQQISGGDLAAAKDPQRGFETFGEYAVAVREGSRPGGNVDERLKIGAAPTTYSNESAGSDGGYAIPPGFSASIKTHMEGPDNFLSMTDDIPVTGNSMSFPKDETVPWGSDGVRAYWEGEGDQATQTKLKLGLSTLRLKKLFALVPITDELLADTTALSAYLPSKAGQSIRYKANDALVNGDGVGKPLGIANADALVVVSKESGQSDNVINVQNISKMYSRMMTDGRSRAVWICHHTALPQIMQLSNANQALWTPDFRVSPSGVLLGRPLIESQTAQALGTQGDIMFVDWKKYATIQKAMQSAMSIHLWFDYDVTAFRLIFRLDGTPWVSAAVSDANGSSSTSPFITLEERAGS